MVGSGVIGVLIERLCLRPLRNVKGPAAMITTIGVSYILFNIILLTVGCGEHELSQSDAAGAVRTSAARCSTCAWC